MKRLLLIAAILLLVSIQTIASEAPVALCRTQIHSNPDSQLYLYDNFRVLHSGEFLPVAIESTFDVVFACQQCGHTTFTYIGTLGMQADIGSYLVRRNGRYKEVEASGEEITVVDRLDCKGRL